MTLDARTTRTAPAGTGALRVQRNTRFDLHLHTTMSDGRYAPDEVVRRCARGGLDVVALTDHDLGTTVPHGVHEVDGRRLHVLAGAELTGVHDGREHHLLVYFAGGIPAGFRDFCRLQCQARAHRYDVAIDHLGLDLPRACAEARSGDRALTRWHLADRLVQAGHATSRRDAFQRHLSRARRVVPNIPATLVDVIHVARAFGGVTSWAHPQLADVERYVATLARAGLQGLEGLRPLTTSRDRKAFRRIAKRYGLFLTGGSDWHGWTEPGLGLFSLEPQQLTGFIDTLRQAPHEPPDASVDRTVDAA